MEKSMYFIDGNVSGPKSHYIVCKTCNEQFDDQDDVDDIKNICIHHSCSKCHSNKVNHQT